MTGTFLCLEGVDGSGKSTQIQLLADWLVDRGRTVVRCREPGGTPIGEKVRALLLDVSSTMSPMCEMLLYMASRAQMLEAVVIPALDRGDVVLTDRFLLSTLVYQGYAGGLAIDALRALGDFATGDLKPDWTGILDLDPRRAIERRSTPADRIEERPLDFHHRVRRGYLAEAQRDPGRITILDADRPPEIVHQRIVEEVTRVLATTGRS